MSIRNITVLSLGFAVGLSACAFSDDAGNDGPGGKADKVGAQNCQPPQLIAVPGGDDVTAARIESLNAYAVDALRSKQCDIDAALARRDALTDDRLMMADRYHLEVGNEATCFNGSFLFADFNLDSDKRYSTMKTQVDMAVEFLTGLHEDMNGVPTVLFDQLIICPKLKPRANEFELSGPRLYVNVPFGQFGGISTFDARELRNDMWTPGEHLVNMPKADLVKTVWPIFDPAGTVRHSLRSGIGSRAINLVRKLISFEGSVFADGEDVLNDDSSVESARAEMRSLVRQEVSATHDVDGMTLAQRMDSAFDNASAEQLACLARKWREFAAEPERWTSTAEATVARTHREAARNSLDIRVTQDAFITIGNSHFVNVDLNIFLSAGYQELERYIEVIEIGQNIEWHQDGGLLAVYTVDDVNVNVQISSERALATAGAEQAMIRCIPGAL